MHFLNPMLMADFYKISHRNLYPKNTTKVYSTWTPRASRIKGVDRVVFFGLQAFIKSRLIEFFNDNFFYRPLDKVVEEYKRIISNTLFIKDPEVEHIKDLHKLGYLPLLIKALPEGTVVPLRVPMFSIHNTDDRFFWLTNYIETLASCELWQASTSATIANEYRTLIDAWANKTGSDLDFVQFQGHDFSMRGMSCLGSAMLSGMGHLLSFSGTDTIPAIQAAEAYYNVDVEKDIVGTSIPATEHSIQCAYEDDIEYFRKTITDTHPTGPVSIVSDGYDFWNVIGSVLPLLKDIIMARDGKVVIRPDSGDPVLIVCGDPDGDTELKRKGAVEALWDIFGGSENSRGFKELDSHIGLIYGDAITLNRCDEICRRLYEKKFATSNIVFGIGSYTYQYNTRDTFGFALKSTMCVIDGVEKMIYKDPKTDDGIKKSQRGVVAVLDVGGKLSYLDGLSLEDHISKNLLRDVYRNGLLLVDDTFRVIKRRMRNQTGERCVDV